MNVLPCRNHTEFIAQARTFGYVVSMFCRSKEQPKRWSSKQMP
jgi:hypothetical protein